MAKYVQISKEIINIREVTDPNKSEEDGCELVHGFFLGKDLYLMANNLRVTHWTQIHTEIFKTKL